MKNTPQNLVDRVLRLAGEAPLHPAVVCGGELLTYAQLAAAAGLVADRLIESGCAAEEPVAISMTRRLEFVIGALGIMMAGACYVPLDLGQSEESRRNLCRKARITRILAARPKVPAKTGDDEIFIPVDISSPPEAAPPPARYDGSALAYQLFTSGSTGVPKLVAIEHRSVCALLDGYDAVAGAGTPVVSTTLCPFSFDVSVWEIFSALTAGGTLHILDERHGRNPVIFTEYLIEHGITTAYIPPMMLPHIIRCFEDIGHTGALERVLVGVEPILQSTLQRLRTVAPAMRIINGYGPTEATICATFYPFAEAADEAERVPIGWPVEGWRIEIVNEDMQPVPPGQTGQILIGGKGLARGYTGDPAETERRFIQWRGERWYKTGDLGHRQQGGAIVFSGRQDTQVKIRGFRVELEEIEAALARCRTVTACTAQIRQDQHGARLFAFVTAAAPAAEIEAFLRQVLPVHMIPARIVVLDAFPLKQNGKIDRDALLELVRCRPEQGYPAVPPGTNAQALFCAIWEEVLDILTVGVTDDFYDLGGDSVRAFAAASRMAAVCGDKSLLGVFLKYRTIEACAAAYEALRPALQSAPPPSSATHDSEAISAGQQGLWVYQSFHPEDKRFVMPVAFEIRGHVSDDLIVQAYRVLIRRHAALRGKYGLMGGKVVCRHSPDLPPVSVETCREDGVVERLKLVFDDMALDIISNFDKIPVRAAVIRVSAEACFLLLAIHHIAIDGASVKWLGRDLADALDGAVLDQHPGDASVFARAQGEYLGSFMAGVDRSYWKKSLAILPAAVSLQARAPLRTVALRQTLTSAEAKAVRAYAKRQKMTPFEIVVGLLADALHIVSGANDFALSTPISLRAMHPALEDAVGYFVNLVPLRFHARQDTYQALRASLEHAQYPFEHILQDCIGPDPDDIRRLTSIVVAQDMETDLPRRFSLGEIHEYVVPRSAPLYDMTVFVSEKNDTLFLTWEFNESIYPSSAIAALQALLNQKLDEI